MNGEEKDLEVYEININKKYIIAFEEMIPNEAFMRIKADISQWLKDKDSPFLIIRGTGNGFKFIKMDDDPNLPVEKGNDEATL